MFLGLFYVLRCFGTFSDVVEHIEAFWDFLGCLMDLLGCFCVVNILKAPEHSSL